MALLASVQDFRAWSGANTPASVSDALIEACLSEAEAGLATECNTNIAAIAANPLSAAIGYGDELRRASRLLARRNSPESISGAGEAGFITIPSRDPDSAASARQIRAVLLIPEGIA